MSHCLYKFSSVCICSLMRTNLQQELRSVSDTRSGPPAHVGPGAVYCLPQQFCNARQNLNSERLTHELIRLRRRAATAQQDAPNVLAKKHDYKSSRCHALQNSGASRNCWTCSICFAACADRQYGWENANSSMSMNLHLESSAFLDALAYFEPNCIIAWTTNPRPAWRLYAIAPESFRMDLFLHLPC